nr:TonB-dependent hemoglobin/transferrin/lactoferrin family receptor [Rhodoferax sp.]
MTRIKSFPPSKLLPSAWAVGWVCLAFGPASAQVTPSRLDVVVVSGSRSEQLRDDLPMSVDVLSASDFENRQMGDIKDLVKDLPNISVKHAPARFTVTGASNSTGRDGNAGFTIRGLGSNRVLMLVDGTRAPRSYVNGNNAFGRDALSLDLIKRVEVVRGPSSVLYGSDGLAGLVNLITHEPLDFLAASGARKDLAGRVSASWSGDDEGIGAAATLAGRVNDGVQWLLTGTTRKSNALSNQGTNDAPNINRTQPNPQTNRGDSLLGKLVLRPSATQKHVITLEHVGKSADTLLLSSRAASLPAPTTTATKALVANETDWDTLRRDRLTWEGRYVLSSAWADQVQTLVSVQNSDAQDNGRTVRNDGGVRVRDTSYSENTQQLGVQASKSLVMSPQWSQKWSYGLDLASNTVTSWFAGSDPAPLAAYVPKKYFPDARDSNAGLYAQSEFASEQWSITPGLRFERFAVDVISQDGYAPPATTPGVSLSGVNTSPKLGALFRVTPQWSVYGNYASGFRAPNAAQLNGFLDPSPGVNARLLPNPDLKPETSQNIELGVRARLQHLSLDVAAFTGDFKQLIVDKKFLGGANTVSNPNVFQTINVDNATIWGLEVKGNMDWGRWGDGAVSTPFTFGLARGRDNGSGLPLNSIDPASATLGMKYDTAAWSLRADVRHHAAKDASDVDPTAGVRAGSTQFTSIPAATTLDITGQWRIRKDLRLTAGVVNATNVKYWLWSDVQGLTTANAVTQADAYTQPGRHINVSLVMEF